MTHYEQRLRTLHYKKKFTIWLNELRPKIQAVLEASKEVQRSKRLKKILELILAFGNYMNRGQRGNAHGFKLNSLTRIADTKSSCNKNMTLLHFMADTCDQKVAVGTLLRWICGLTWYQRDYVLVQISKRLSLTISTQID